MDKGKPAPNADVNLRRFIERIDTVKDGPITDPSVKNAVSEHRKREQIKSMSTPLIWSQDELYERKVVFAGMRERALLNAFREVRTRLLQKSKSDNIVVLVSSIAENGGGTFVAFNLAATFALDRHKTALYVDCNPYQSTAEKYRDRKSTRLNSSHVAISYAVFCLKKKKTKKSTITKTT